MVIEFTELEKQYLIINKGDWKIKDTCPERMKRRLEKKIEMLNNEYKRGNNHGSQSNR